MKTKFLYFLLITLVVTTVSSCSIFRRKEKYGCPTDGRNVGAEVLMSGDAKAIKKAKKAKFRG